VQGWPIHGLTHVVLVVVGATVDDVVDVEVDVDVVVVVCANAAPGTKAMAATRAT
jgi:hypothetical protein